MRNVFRPAPAGPPVTPPPGASMARWQLPLRALILLLPLGAVAAARGAAPGLLIVLVVAGAAVAAGYPDTPAGLGVVILVGWLWCTQVDADVTGWTLVAALSVGAFHVTTAFAAVLPAGAAWDTESARRWLHRLAVVLAATTAMWAVAFGVSRTGTVPNAILLGAGLVIATGLAAMLLARSVGPDQ
ncbi:hypothetical protein [Desertimonas flava]|jgi:hypothetical protein|uniref:hypothetical protein n=1 Tax=Desertimonas flava TaxID=2064846 RepID=UPI000E350A7A|nr:hypothetical protein [Desertimonas flava]